MLHLIALVHLLRCHLPKVFKKMPDLNLASLLLTIVLTERRDRLEGPGGAGLLFSLP